MKAAANKGRWLVFVDSTTEKSLAKLRRHTERNVAMEDATNKLGMIVRVSACGTTEKCLAKLRLFCRSVAGEDATNKLIVGATVSVDGTSEKRMAKLRRHKKK